MAVLQATEISGSITLSQPLRVPSLTNTAIGNITAQEKAQLVFSSTDGDLHRHDSSNIVRGFGYQGLQGTLGSKGTDGAAGTSGYHGLQGLQGTAGLGGDTGARSGVKGPKGPQGPKGAKGTNNVQTGATGTKGPKGPQGPHGYSGNLGAGGGTGARGLRAGVAGGGGYQGYHGETNNAQGPTGPKGPKGVHGYTGNLGATGGAGAIGAKSGTGGPTGYQGYHGETNNAAGVRGGKGPKGVHGYTGQAGATGYQGAPGWPYQAMNSNSTPTFNQASVGHTAQSSAYKLWTSSHYAVNHTEMYNTNNYGMAARGNAATMQLINKNNAVASTFYSNGNIYHAGGRASDERAKTQIEQYTGSGAEPSASIVDRLSDIKPKKFRFINTPSTYPTTIGLIAQDVKLKFPELVNAKNDGTGSAVAPEMMGINFDGLRAVLYEAVKELKTELSGITNRVTTLESV